MLPSGFSQRGVGYLLLLSYQLKDPVDGKHLFSEHDTPVNKDDVLCEDLSDNPMQTRRTHEPLPPTSSVEHEAQAYAYLAATTLRLFTKSEGNYVLAFNHIVTKYAEQYGYSMIITPPQPTEEALRTLSHYFSHGGVFRSTLYRLLYMGGGMGKRGKGIRQFAYEMHLANTGMHIVSIFARLCNVLKCEPGLLMAAINSKEFSRQVDALVTMIEMSAGKKAGHERKMWMYGRIFDQTFMSPLQTKSCPQLVYILASALKNASTKSNQDILKIVQLQGFNASKKRRLAAAGEMVVKMIRQHLASSGSSLDP